MQDSDLLAVVQENGPENETRKTTISALREAVGGLPDLTPLYVDGPLYMRPIGVQYPYIFDKENGTIKAATPNATLCSMLPPTPEVGKYMFDQLGNLFVIVAYNEDGHVLWAVRIASQQSPIELYSPSETITIQRYGNEFHLDVNAGSSAGNSSISFGVESFPFTLTDGGMNLHNEFRAIQFTPLASFTATMAQINVLANHTSQTFEIAIYEIASGNLIATTGTINFAGSSIGLRSEALTQPVQLQAGTLYMLALFVTGSNRYVGARRFRSELGGQNMDYIIQGSTTSAPNAVSGLNIHQRYPNSNQIDMPYIHVF